MSTERIRYEYRNRPAGLRSIQTVAAIVAATGLKRNQVVTKIEIDLGAPGQSDPNQKIRVHALDVEYDQNDNLRAEGQKPLSYEIKNLGDKYEIKELYDANGEYISLVSENKIADAQDPLGELDEAFGADLQAKIESSLVELYG